MTNVLTACSHSGLVQQALDLVGNMEQRFGIKPDATHHVCLIDALGRANRLLDAKNYLSRLSLDKSSNLIAYKTLLGAARTFKNVEVAEEMAGKLKEFTPRDASARVLLSNTYALVGRWADRDAVRDGMKREGVWKTPGMTRIQVDGVVHKFVVHEKNHPRIDEIKRKWASLQEELKRDGYVMDRSHLLHDLKTDAEVEDHLCGHSEKIAITFGLIATPEGTPLTLIKNLRVCPDCHKVTKRIAKKTGRKISVRDANRWHHFTPDGECNCNDYW
jgi:pentatricopeptide repeat protein